MRLRIVRDSESGLLGFDLLGDGDVALLHHRGSRDRQACLDGIQALIERIADVENFALRRLAADPAAAPAPTDALRLLVEGRDGVVLAQSAGLPTERAGTALRDRILAAASSQQHYDVALDDHEPAGARSVLPFLRKAADTALLYDFSWLSRSQRPGFECFHREDRGLYFFHFNGPDGAAILYSRGFDTAPRRDSRLRAVVENAGMRQRFERIGNDGPRFLLKSRNGQEIARSRAFASEEERETALAFVATHAARYGEAYIRRHESRIAARDQYRLDLGGVAGGAGFHLLRHDEDRLYYFVFQDEQGRALFFSQGYRSRESRDNGLRSLIRNGAESERAELVHEDGRYYWVLRAANHQALARSQWFAEREAAAAALALFRGQISPWAEKLGVELAVRRTTRESLQLSTARPPERKEGPGADAAAAVAAAVVAAPLVAAPLIAAPLVAAPLVAAPPPAAPPAETAPPPHAEPATQPPHAEPASQPAEPATQPPHATPPSVDEAVIVAASPAAPAAPPRSEEPAPAPVPPPLPPAPRDASRAPLPDGAAAAAAPSPAESALVQHAPNRAPAHSPRARSRALLWVAAGLCALSLFITWAWALRSCGEPAALPRARRALDGAVADLRAGSGADLQTGSGPDAAGSDSRADLAPPSVLRSGPSAPVLTIPGHPGLTLRPGSMEAELLAYLQGGDGEPRLRTFTMDRLLYPKDSHEMDAEGQEQTYLLGLLLLAFPRAQVEIRGHSDPTESERYTGPKPHRDYPLSKLRAHCVYLRVINQGVRPERLRMTGLASTQPVSDEATEAGRQQDRRVELVVRR